MNYNRIEELRIQKNFTKEGLAKAIGKSRQWYNDLFNVKNIRVRELEAIAKVFDVPITYFFDDDAELIASESASSYGKESTEITLETIVELQEQLKIKDEQIKFLQHLIEEKL